MLRPRGQPGDSFALHPQSPGGPSLAIDRALRQVTFSSGGGPNSKGCFSSCFEQPFVEISDKRKLETELRGEPEWLEIPI